DHGVGEIDFDLGAEPRRIGPQLAKALAHRDLHGLQDLNKAARRRLCDNAGLINGGDERRRAAIHDRNFGTVDLDGGVVDAHAAERCEHMLGGRNQGQLAVAEDCCEFGGNNGVGGGADLAIAAIKSGADKNKTRIDRCRSDGEADGRTRMYTDASYSGLRTKRCLPAKLHWKPAHHDLPLSPIPTALRPLRTLGIPKSRADDNRSPKQRQLTLLYRLLPYLGRIRAKA